MHISINDIVSKTGKVLEFPVNLDSKEFDLPDGTYSINNFKPFNISVSHINHELSIKGNSEISFTATCGRCIEDVEVEIPFEIDKRFPIEGGLVVMDADEEYSFLDEDLIDIDRLIYEEVLVNWPDKILCKEDCKGLCSVCGANLNRGECGCDRLVIDPRMAQFQDIFDQFKEV